MAVSGRIPVRHEDVFTQPVMLASVDPVKDFEKDRAKVEDPQERDKETGQRLWAVSVIDWSAPAGHREIKIKMAADQQPVSSGGIGQPVEFEGLQVVPWVDGRGCKSRPDARDCKGRVAIAYRAAGFRSSKPSAKAAA